MAIINIRGVLVDIMLKIAPGVYGQYVITERKVINQIIFQFQNAIYCTMTASLLYYKKLRKSIEDKGYEFNPYGPCFANKIIKGSHITVCFHLDYFNLSHKSPKLLDNTITWLKQEYESIFEYGSGEIIVHKLLAIWKNPYD